MQFWLPYQQAWLLDKSPIRIWEKSRRIGATFVQSWEDFTDCISGKVKDVWFSSTDENAAKEYLEYVKLWVQLFETEASLRGRSIIKSPNDITAERVKFSNGARITALSSNPKNFRGKGGKVVLDEFAHHDDAMEMWTAAMPTTAHGFQLVVMSTHNGSGTLFYKLLHDKAYSNIKLSRHYTDIEQAVEQGLLHKIKQRETTKEEQAEFVRDIASKCATPAIFEQEFKCNPYASLGAKVCYNFHDDNIMDLQYLPGLDLHLCCDFNYSPNCWVLAHKTDDKMFFIDEYCKDLPTEQLIKEVMRDYPHPGRIVINGDASGHQKRSETDFTNYELIRNHLVELGYKDEGSRCRDGKRFVFEVDGSNGRRAIRFASFNKMLLGNDLIRRLFFSPKCERVLYNMRNLTVIEGTDKFKEPTIKQIEKDPDLRFLGHPFDAISYPVNRYWQIQRATIEYPKQGMSLLEEFRSKGR